MCLNKVISKSNDERKYTGYKVFDTFGSGYTFPFFNNHMVEIGKEMTANRVMVYSGRQRYMSGFHIFKSAKSARNYRRTGTVVFKVRYHGFVTKGLQTVQGCARRCDVAKFMTIIEKVNI
jgi:hypothetical protein